MIFLLLLVKVSPEPNPMVVISPWIHFHLPYTMAALAFSAEVLSALFNICHYQVCTTRIHVYVGVNASLYKYIFMCWSTRYLISGLGGHFHKWNLTFGNNLFDYQMGSLTPEARSFLISFIKYIWSQNSNSIRISGRCIRNFGSQAQPCNTNFLLHSNGRTQSILKYSSWILCIRANPFAKNAIVESCTKNTSNYAVST